MLKLRRCLVQFTENLSFLLKLLGNGKIYRLIQINSLIQKNRKHHGQRKRPISVHKKLYSKLKIEPHQKWRSKLNVLEGSGVAAICDAVILLNLCYFYKIHFSLSVLMWLNTTTNVKWDIGKGSYHLRFYLWYITLHLTLNLWY